MTIFERIQAVLTFRNGTEIELSEHDIISASIKRQCCSDGKFEIGGVYAASLSMKCRVSGTNSFRIRGAKIVVSTKFEGIEQDFQPLGTFWITDAPKTGEIYSITAVDNVGWLDIDNYTTAATIGDREDTESVWENFTEYFRNAMSSDNINEIHSLFGKMTPHVNSLINRMTGLQNVLNWGHYVEGHEDETTHEWVGNALYCNHKDLSNNLNYYSLFEESDKYFSGTPLDLYKKLAEIAGGFVYARPEDGWLTMGQFGQKEFYSKDGLVSDGTIEIYPEHMEQDSFEFADFSLLAFQVSARNNYKKKNNSGYDIDSRWYYEGGWDAVPFEQYSPYVITIENNSFIDGYVDLHIIHSDSPRHHKDNLCEICKTMHSYLSDTQNRPLVPFRCKVHKPERYQLGQRIDFYNENQEIICRSVITSIQWTFRGGTWLSCAGKDERVLSGCARISKADKAIRSVNAGYFYKKQEEQEG